MIRCVRLAFAVLLALAVTGCVRVTRPPGCVPIGPGALCLLPPAALPKVAGQRLLTIVHGGNRQDLVSYLQIDATTLRLVNSTLLGLPAFTLTWDGRHVVVEPAAAHVDGDRIVALLELALASPQALGPRLAGLRLDVSTEGVRRLVAHGRTLVEIERKGGALERASFTIQVPSAGIRMTLQPLKGTP